MYNSNALKNDSRNRDKLRHFEVLFFHPIAVQFWSSLVTVYGISAIRAAVAPLEIDLFLEIFNPDDPVRRRNGNDLNPMHVTADVYAGLPEDYRKWYSIF